MVHVVTTEHGFFDPAYLASWMSGNIVSTGSHQIIVENAGDSSSYKGIYSGDFSINKWGDISGTIDTFSRYFRDSSYTYLTITGIKANAAKVFAMIENSHTKDLPAYILRGDDQIDTTQHQSLYGYSDIRGYNGNDMLRSGSMDDRLAGGNGNDKLLGGGGSDTLIGGRGRDLLVGDSGADHFIFQSARDSGVTAATRDVIHDFTHTQHDIISVKPIDADQHAGGNQSFLWLGKHSFTETAGELRYSATGKNTIVFGDIDGDGHADFSLALTSKHNLSVNDFQL